MSSDQGPMSEDAQMRLKRGAMKGGLSSKEGTREPTEQEVKEKGPMSKESQERLMEGAKKGGSTRAAQIGKEGYEEMGKKGGLSRMGVSGEEAAKEKGIEIDESKYKTKS